MIPVLRFRIVFLAIVLLAPFLTKAAYADQLTASDETRSYSDYTDHTGVEFFFTSPNPYSSDGSSQSQTFISQNESKALNVSGHNTDLYAHWVLVKHQLYCLPHLDFPDIKPLPQRVDWFTGSSISPNAP